MNMFQDPPPFDGKDEGKQEMSSLAARIGQFILTQHASPADMYEAAGMVLVAMCEASIFSSDGGVREQIREAILADLGRVTEYVKDFDPKTKEEFIAARRLNKESLWDS